MKKHLLLIILSFTVVCFIFNACGNQNRDIDSSELNTDSNNKSTSTESETESSTESELDNEKTHLEFIFDSESNAYAIASIGTCTDTSITIPTTHNGLPVTAINHSAFENCSFLETIVIPSSVTYIGDYAFSNCKSLKNITIPESVTHIGDYCFKDCNSLTGKGYDNAIYLGNDINPYLLLLKSKYINTKTCEIHKDSKFIHSEAFSNCALLTNITFSKSTISIGKYAFSYCSSLETVTIPKNIKSIGTYAFYQSGITNLTIENGCSASIGSRAFAWCPSLENVSIPESITSIDNSFEGESNMYNISLSLNEYDNAYYLGNDENPYVVLIKAKDKSITSCTINEKTKFIHKSAFSSCFSLEDIKFGNSIKSIGDFAFSHCTSLKSVDIPNGATHIGYYAFSDCSSLANVKIPNSLSCIKEYAFNECVSLVFNEYKNAYYIGNNANPYLLLIKAKDTSITNCTIHDNTKFITNHAFSDCSLLETITLGKNITYIGEYSFNWCDALKSIVIPSKVIYTGQDSFSNCKLITIFCEAESQPSAWRDDWNSTDCPVYWYSEEEPTGEGNYWRYVDGEIIISE